MTDLRKAAEMALNYFESAYELDSHEIEIRDALRQALAQPQPVQFKCTVVDDGHPNGVPLSQWGRQPEQEPVAWITPDGEGFRIRFSPPVNDMPLGWEPLYTAPPKREWVGITKEDKKEILEMTQPDERGYVIAITEAKLKGKNS